MMKWMMIFSMILVVAACSPKTYVGDNDNDLTPKSGEIKNAPELQKYDDLKLESEGTMLSSKELANKICFCSFEINRMSEDIKRYHRNNDKNSLLRVKSKVDGAFAKFDKCMAEVKAKYPRAVAENDPQEVFREVSNNCPTLIEVMEAGNKNLMKSGEEN